MYIDYDAKKNQKNIKERGLSFDRAADLDWETALIAQDFRKKDVRNAAFARLDGRLHFIGYIEIQDGIRVISFRKANKREVKIYEE